MKYIKENILKFEKLYYIVEEHNNYELLTPNYFKYLKTLIYFSGFINNLFLLEKNEIYEDDILHYKNEIEKFYQDSIEIYTTIKYDNEIQEIIFNL
jgi:hypothetical protein